jgi:hypothetical protein
MHERIAWLLRELELDAAEALAELADQAPADRLLAAAALVWTYLDRHIEADVPPALWPQARLAVLDAWARVRRQFTTATP